MRKILKERLTHDDLLAFDEQVIIDAYPTKILETLRWGLRNDALYVASVLDALALLVTDRKLRNKDGTATTTKQLEDLVRTLVPGLWLILDVPEEELMAKKKEFREILEELPRQGWTLAQTAQGHWRAAPPDKALTIVHFSETDDPHGQLNIVRDLTKRGFQWPPISKNEQAGADRMTDPTAKLQKDLLKEETYPSRRNGSIEPAATHAGVPLQASGQSAEAWPMVKAVEAPLFGKTEDQLFNELKEARSYAALATEHYKECQRAVEAATKELTSADRERTKAAEDLAAKKAAFDKAFEST